MIQAIHYGPNLAKVQQAPCQPAEAASCLSAWATYRSRAFLGRSPESQGRGVHQFFGGQVIWFVEQGVDHSLIAAGSFSTQGASG